MNESKSIQPKDTFQSQGLCDAPKQMNKKKQMYVRKKRIGKEHRRIVQQQ